MAYHNKGFCGPFIMQVWFRSWVAEVNFVANGNARILHVLFWMSIDVLGFYSK